MSDPVIHAENGRLRLELPGRPDDRAVYSVSGALLQGVVDQINGLRAERDRLRTALQRIVDLPGEPSDFGSAVYTAKAALLGTPSLHPTTRDLDRMEGPATGVPRTQHVPADSGCGDCGTCVGCDGCADPANPLDLARGDCEACGACGPCIAECRALPRTEGL